MSQENATLSALHEFEIWYRPVHGYTAPIICACGFFGNVLGSVVLVDLEMVTPISIFLTGLAISNAMTLVLYIPFAALLINFDGKPGAKSWYTNAVMSGLAHIIINTTAISNWLTVTIAIYMLAVLQRVCDPFKGISTFRAKQINYAVYVTVTVLSTPNYYTLSRSQKPLPGDMNVWNMGTGGALSNIGIMDDINVIVHAFLMRLMPCIVLTTVVAIVVKVMHRAVLVSRELPVASSSEMSRWKSNRINTLIIARMLMGVLFIFTITESSNGVLMLLAHEYEYVLSIYMDLGHVLATMALINYAFIFLMYSFMSKQFRRACKQANCGHVRHESM